MVKILREADKLTVAEVAKKHGISEQTLYVWKRKFGTMDVPDAKRLKALELENARLKRLLADGQLENSIMKEIAAKKMVSAPARRRQVEFARNRGLYKSAANIASVDGGVDASVASSCAGSTSASLRSLSPPRSG